ncbi:MAG: heavy metal translocating P-type ATPase [Bdellovibrionales bacterium]
MERHAIPDDLPLHGEIEPAVQSEGATGDTAGYESLAQHTAQGDYTLSLLVGGVHCAACIHKIESALAAQAGVKAARLNFSTRRLSVTWQGEPEAANAYVRAVEKSGYTVQPYDIKAEETQTKAQERFLLLCLGVAGFAMGNVMLLSVGVWSASSETMGTATRDLMHWASALIALPTILFSGRPFFRSALGALRAGRANMDVPISLALILAGGMSLFETFHHGEHVYFDSAVMLMFFLLIGRYLDFRARKQARSTANDLLGALSGFASVLEGGKLRRLPVRDLREGMVIRVAAGEKFPTDGTVIAGQSEVDTALITGESLPHAASEGTKIYAGTLNLNTPLDIKVAKAAEDSLLADIVRLMEQAEQGQAKYVRLADRAARLYTPVVHTMAALAFAGWWGIAGAPWQDSLMIAVTVLIITCPCALGLAVPVVQVLAAARLMRRNILVKSGDALERLARIDTVMLDKTGTLTLGQIRLCGDYADNDLQLAASLAGHSAHPLSKALSNAYKGALLDNMKDVKEHQGQGLEGVYQGRTIRLGSRAWCGDKTAKSSGNLEIWLQDGDRKTVFRLSDHLRNDAAETIERFKSGHITPYLVSGDREDIVTQIARQAGIDNIYAAQTPPQKFERLQRLKSHGHTILMVGDGLNDAPVLAGADVSIAPGTAIDLAQNAADIIFMGNDFAPVYTAYETAVLTQKLVKQNFALAALYNLIALPLALCGFVTPLIAALAMSGSSLVVIANSFRLNLKR